MRSDRDKALRAKVEQIAKPKAMGCAVVAAVVLAADAWPMLGGSKRRVMLALTGRSSRVRHTPAPTLFGGASRCK